MRWLISLFMVGFCGFLIAGMSEEEFKQAEKEMNSAISEKRTSVAKDLIAKIASDDSGRAVQALVTAFKKGISDFDIVTAIRDGLLRMTSKSAKDAMFAQLKGGDEKVKVMILDALSGMSGSDVTQAIIGALRDSSEIVAVSAARALGNRSERESIEPLIDELEKAEKAKRTRIQYEINIALEKITGKSGLEASIDWRNWWSTHKDKPLGGKQEEIPFTPNPLERKKLETTSFFGIEIRSKRVIFIIDVSGSMIVADPPPENWREETEKKLRTTVVDEKEREKRMKEAEEQMKKWEEERKRIYRVKKELIKTIKTLSKDVKFNIIAFSDNIQCWKKSLTEATEANRNNAIAWVEKLQADGLTWTDVAIEEAFKDKEVDTIVLLTDGAPTHAGGEAKPEWDGHQDSRALIAHILEWVRKENLFRKITIHTLGFISANFEFLKKLSAENNGKFEEIK
ncbi:MAG: VWA domain-containing protein [Planctomycetota bacterium]|nr:VWA domain-containing protein [Planctomycetota bacterium]